MNCTCPKTTELTTIPESDCPFDMGQIQKYGFQRRGHEFVDATNNVRALASWQPLLTANDATKVVVTPFIGADPVVVAGDAITTGGGDNSTLNGIERVEGVNPANATAMFKSLSSAQEKAMQALGCEENDLVTYFFLEGGNIAVSSPTVATTNVGFDIQSFFLSDRNANGFGQSDTHSMSFYLPSGWSNDLVIIKRADLDFNPLTQLK